MISRKIGWKEVCYAVRHDMFPVMATSMEAALATLSDIDPQDFSPLTVDRVIGALHEKRKLSTMEVAAIKKLVERTRDYKEEGERLSLVLIQCAF